MIRIDSEDVATNRFRLFRLIEIAIALGFSDGGEVAKMARRAVEGATGVQYQGAGRRLRALVQGGGH